jgi:N-acetylglutamate synthase-like GNAT family acetyltransferase
MIRLASKFDIPRLVDIMAMYAKESPIKALQLEKNQDADYVANLLFSLIAGRGFIYVDDELQGMIAGIKTQNIWCPSVIELRELAWWVEPNKRNGSLGGRLWKTFDDKAKQMKEDGLVDCICCTVMSTSPLIDYVKRGYEPLEKTFYRE